MKRKTITLKSGTIVYLTRYDGDQLGNNTSADVALVDERLTKGTTGETEADALDTLAAHLKTIAGNLEGIASALRREEREQLARYKAMSPITVKEPK